MIRESARMWPLVPATSQGNFTSTLDEFGTEFPHAVGRVAKRALASHGFTTYAHLAGTTRGELLAIHGIGPKAVRILAEELARRGMSFTED